MAMNNVFFENLLDVEKLRNAITIESHDIHGESSLEGGEFKKFIKDNFGAGVTFEIYSEINPPVDPGNLRVTYDSSEYYDVFEKPVLTGAATEGQPTGIVGAPEGVTVKEAN